MRKIFLSLVALIVLINANAQKGLGIQGGVNFSTWTGSSVSGAKLKTGFQAGVNYSIPVGYEFSVITVLIICKMDSKAVNRLIAQ